MIENDVFTVIDDNNVKKDMIVLLTFEDKRLNRKYIVYYEKGYEEKLYASVYNEDGSLSTIETDEEWDMVDEVIEGCNGLEKD